MFSTDIWFVQLAAIALNCVNLEYLNLVNTKKITRDGYRPIANLKQLRDLNMWGGHASTIESVTHIVTNCTRLENLVLRFHLELTDDFIGVMCQALPGLKVLDLGYCLKLTPASIVHLLALHSITQLGLREVKIQQSDLGEFKTQHPQCKVLTDREN